MNPSEPSTSPAKKAEKRVDAAQSNRFAEAKKKFESMNAPQAPKPQQRTPERPSPAKEVPTSEVSTKKESPYGYFMPAKQKPESSQRTSMESSGDKLEASKSADQTAKHETKIDWSRMSGKYNVPVQANPAKAEVERSGENNAHRLSGPYNVGKPVEPKQPDATKVDVETPAQNGPNVHVERKLASNEEIGSGKFIVGGDKNWIQKDDKTNKLIHYDASHLTDSQKAIITKSMEEPRKPVTVATNNKKLTITPRH